MLHLQRPWERYSALRSRRCQRGRTFDDPVKAFPVPIRRFAFSHESGPGKPARASTISMARTKASRSGPRAGAIATPRNRSRFAYLPADLSDWRYRPEQNHIAVDPELGRIVLSESSYLRVTCTSRSTTVVLRKLAVANILVSSVNNGQCGHRFMKLARDSSSRRSRVHRERWLEEKPRYAAIEVADSGVYQEQIHLAIAAKQHLEMRAANGVRPIDPSEGCACEPARCGNDLRQRTKQFCVGWNHGGWPRHSYQRSTGDVDDSPHNAGSRLVSPSVMASLDEPGTQPLLQNLTARITISHSILGGNQILQESAEVDPLHLRHCRTAFSMPIIRALSRSARRMDPLPRRFCGCVIAR